MAASRSADITDLVLEEVRSLRAKLSATDSSSFISSSDSRPSLRDSSSSVRESSSSVREYSAHPYESSSATSMASIESRKRPLEGDVEELKLVPTKPITPVLRYSLSNVTYRVNLEALSRVFSQYGRLIKLTRFPNHGTVSGYVQFETVAAAEMTIAKLQGRNIYHGCCRLHLTATDIVDLTIRRDLEGSDHALDHSAKRVKGGGEGSSRRVPDRRDGGQAFFPPASYNREDAFRSPPMGLVPDSRDKRGFERDLGLSPDDGDLGFGRPRGHLGAAPILNLWPNEIYGGMLGPAEAFGVVANFPLKVRQAKTVLFVANLNEAKVNTERLFMIFGVYCDILKIKIFYHERSKALIQTVDGGQADTARRFMDGIKLWGQTLSVTFASNKYQEVNIVANAEENWAKDFSHSSNHAHRFRGTYGLKHLQNVTKPIPTLYVSNVPKGTSEEMLKKFFQESLRDEEEDKRKAKSVRFESDETNDDETPSSTSSSSSSSVVRVQFFPKSEFMAFVEMSDVDAAFEAIIRVHNKRMDARATRGKSLFLNFSKVHLEDFNKSGWDTLFRG